MAGNGCCSLHRELKDCGSGTADEVLPEDRVNVGGVGVAPAGILLSRHAAMVGVVELDLSLIHNYEPTRQAEIS